MWQNELPVLDVVEKRWVVCSFNPGRRLPQGQASGFDTRRVTLKNEAPVRRFVECLRGFGCR